MPVLLDSLKGSLILVDALIFGTWNADVGRLDYRPLIMVITVGRPSVVLRTKPITSIIAYMTPVC